MCTGCGPSAESRHRAGYLDGYAEGYNTELEIRDTLVEGAWHDRNYSSGYQEGRVDGVRAAKLKLPPQPLQTLEPIPEKKGFNFLWIILPLWLLFWVVKKCSVWGKEFLLESLIPAWVEELKQRAEKENESKEDNDIGKK
jgi:hypothetical protein